MGKNKNKMFLLLLLLVLPQHEQVTAKYLRSASASKRQVRRLSPQFGVAVNGHCHDGNDGWYHVFDPVLCSKGSMAMEGDDVTPHIATSASVPPGCYYKLDNPAGDQLILNQNHTSTMVCTRERQCICQYLAMTPSPTPSTPTTPVPTPSPLPSSNSLSPASNAPTPHHSAGSVERSPMADFDGRTEKIFTPSSGAAPDTATTPLLVAFTVLLLTVVVVIAVLAVVRKRISLCPALRDIVDVDIGNNVVAPLAIVVANPTPPAHAMAPVLDPREIQALRRVVLEKRQTRRADGDGEFPRFTGLVTDFQFGEGDVAAGSLAQHMRAPNRMDQLRRRMTDPDAGYVEAIRYEVNNHPQGDVPIEGSEGLTLIDWFNYVETNHINLHINQPHFNTLGVDSGRGPTTFQDFCQTARGMTNAAGINLDLSDAEVLALRLYTTKAYWRFNGPLRNGETHPMPMTMLFLADGLRKLRPMAVGELHADGASLWRGMKDLDVQGRFLQHGGTELACMSTSTSLEVAADYSCRGEPGAQALIIKLRVRRNEFLSYGADLRWLSAFPEERERLFPPLTYLKPTNRVQEVDIEGIHFKIIEVEPRVTN